MQRGPDKAGRTSTNACRELLEQAGGVAFARGLFAFFWIAQSKQWPVVDLPPRSEQAKRVCVAIDTRMLPTILFSEMDEDRCAQRSCYRRNVVSAVSSRTRRA